MFQGVGDRHLGIYIKKVVEGSIAYQVSFENVDVICRSIGGSFGDRRSTSKRQQLLLAERHPRNRGPKDRRSWRVCSTRSC